MTFVNGAFVGLELRFWVTLCLMNTDAMEERTMAKNVYQGLVMGIFSSDVETKHKKENYMFLKGQACIKQLFSDRGLKDFKCCMSLKYTVS